MKLLALTALLLTATARFVPRDEYKRFSDICYDVNVTNTNTVDDAVWTLEGNCGVLDERKKDTLGLDACVGNQNGGLVWRKEFVDPPWCSGYANGADTRL